MANEAQTYQSIWTPLRDKWMWLVLRDNSFNQRHIITDALKHRDETPSVHSCHSIEQHINKGLLIQSPQWKTIWVQWGAQKCWEGWSPNEFSSSPAPPERDARDGVPEYTLTQRILQTNKYSVMFMSSVH